MTELHFSILNLFILQKYKNKTRWIIMSAPIKNIKFYRSYDFPHFSFLSFIFIALIYKTVHTNISCLFHFEAIAPLTYTTTNSISPLKPQIEILYFENLIFSDKNNIFVYYRNMSVKLHSIFTSASTTSTHPQLPYKIQSKKNRIKRDYL
ncbi:hypothetical protein Bhyg_06573 [Pseudolycoriella hygida]|uniref:Uncharacterized protein n=1 Tax=Pseudolycoriella hygida TaxID=35572 RepID=A0A9Q0N132_9DIPT|nr:hypothetical protein Bhyg_06573 [Pseudolycoriella hygida]